MKLHQDLKSPAIIHAKGLLFVVLGFLSGGLLIAQTPTLKTIGLIIVTVWAFSRFYYYLFYVLERYLGREKRFTGILDALNYLLRSPSCDPTRPRTTLRGRATRLGKSAR